MPKGHSTSNGCKLPSLGDRKTPFPPFPRKISLQRPKCTNMHIKKKKHTLRRDFDAPALDDSSLLTVLWCQSPTADPPHRLELRCMKRQTAQPRSCKIAREMQIIPMTRRPVSERNSCWRAICLLQHRTVYSAQKNYMQRKNTLSLLPSALSAQTV